MDTSRQALRRSTSSNELSVELPCYEVEELTDFQVSAPILARPNFDPGKDKETTEELLDPIDDRRGEATGSLASRKRSLEHTQPIPLTGLPLEPKRPRVLAEREKLQRPQALRKESPRTEVTTGDLLAGRYDVVEKVDHRGMGLVYKALDRHREKAGSPLPWVALKFARPAVDSTAETSTYLRQEFLKLSQLNHPNVVSVFDLACDNGLDFIVMEWLNGETLASMLSRISTKRIALDKATEIVRSAARGLAHAHDLGIVHGDVKPSNIFVTENRIVKVLDFGSSGTTTNSASDSEPNWATRAYASCEVLLGNAPQPHDDVFALGVTAYCLLAGERPFGGLDALEARHRKATPESLLPPGAQDRWPALRSALHFDAIDRPGTAKLFLREFDEPPAEPPPQAAARVHSPTVAYGALAATLLASVVWWSVQSVGGLPPDAESALASGDKALAEGRLLNPEQDSALSYYSAVLEIEPENRHALAGLDNIAEQFLMRAREAITTNNAEAARTNIELAKSVSPDHFGIAVIEDLLASHGRDVLVRARQAAATDPEHAEALRAQAATLLPADDPGLERLREQLSRQDVENRLGWLLQEIDQRILSERLTVPRGDSAVDLLQRAKELAPDARVVSMAADRIVTALLFQAMFATSNGDLNDAEDFLNAAKAMNIKHLALRRAEYQLAKARRDALSASRIRSRD